MSLSSARLRRSPGPVIASSLAVLLVASCVGASGSAPDASVVPTVAPPSQEPPPPSPESADPNGTRRARLLPVGPAAPSPAPAPSPASSPPGLSADPPAEAPTAPGAELQPPARHGPFSIDLYLPGDFVSQTTDEWCVPAAILTMMNVIDSRLDQGPRPAQVRLNQISRSLSSPRLRGAGSEPEGWAATLGRFGYGPYAVVAPGAREGAIETAARALRLTRKPVGILIWRGTHAWVMTGFEATADPGWTDDFRVTHVRVSDPWYPRPRGSWGRTLAPDARISVAALSRVYLPWRRPLARYAELDGRFVLVLPLEARPPGPVSW